MLDGRVRERSYLEAEAYIETKDTHGPRGMGEASVVPFEIRKSNALSGPGVEVRVAGIDDPIHVPLAVLKASVVVAEGKPQAGRRRS